MFSSCDRGSVGRLKAAMQGDVESAIQRLDAVCIHAIFELLSAESLACAACVSRGWRDVAADDTLWQLACSPIDGDDYRRNSAAQLPEIAAGLLHPAPSNPTLPYPIAKCLCCRLTWSGITAALGGWRQVCKWRWRAARRGKSRLFVEAEGATMISSLRCA